jgi:hypothetical protein
MKTILNSLALSLFVFALSSTHPVSAQQVNASARESRSVPKGANPGQIRIEVKAAVENKAILAAIKTFNIRETPDVIAKVPKLTELFFNNITVRWEASDPTEVMATATISVDVASFRKALVNEGIGAGDGAVSGAKILISIDEFLGMGTANQRGTPEERTVTYSHDKSTFSDRSSTAAGSQSASASSASSSRDSFAGSASERTAVAGSSSSSFAASDRASMAGSDRAALAARDGSGGQVAAARQTNVAASRDTRVAGSQSSNFAGASQSSVAVASQSERANASSSQSASSFSASQNDVQQRNDKVSFTVTERMPSYANAKPLAGGDRVLPNRLGGEFEKSGLTLVSEQDLRAEGGRILPVFEIVNNGRFQDFVGKIKQKGLMADVWAYGTASYTLDNRGGTIYCNGTLDVQAIMLDNNESLATNSLKANARGSNDQECRATLALSLATDLARSLGQSALEKLNARASRGNVYDLFIYSRENITLMQRRVLFQALDKVGIQRVSEASARDGYVAIKVQFAGGSLMDKLIDAVAPIEWLQKADLRDKGNQICLGVEGPRDCPAQFR